MKPGAPSPNFSKKHVTKVAVLKDDPLTLESFQYEHAASCRGDPIQSVSREELELTRRGRNLIFKLRNIQSGKEHVLGSRLCGSEAQLCC